MGDNVLKRWLKKASIFDLQNTKNSFSFQFLIFEPPSSAFAATLKIFFMTILFAWFKF